MSNTRVKLSTKIYFGFGVILAIATTLGAIAVYNLSSIKTESGKLSNEYVPEVQLANDVERLSYGVMYDARGYGFSGEEQYQQGTEKNLKALWAQIDKTEKFADRATHLKKLKSALGTVKEKVNQYEDLWKKTIETTHNMEKLRHEMDLSAQKFMKASADYLEVQNRSFDQDLKDKKSGTALKERVEKINWINDVIDYGNMVRIANFKSQALRDPKIIQETLGNFERINGRLTEILAQTTQQINIDQLNAIKLAGGEYQKALNDFLASWMQLQNLNSERTVVGGIVVKTASETAVAGVNETMNIAEYAAAVANKSFLILIVGLIIAILFGAVLAFTITTGLSAALAKVVESLKSGADQIVSASVQLSSASQQLSASSSEQASSIEETSSSLEELGGMIENNVSSAEQAFKLSSQVKDVSEKSNETMEMLQHAMEEILVSNEKIEQLVRVIGNIGDKTRVMDEIVFQTKLLSFNASVEAERAGEHGRGFAVVAQEVGNLAQMSGKSAQEIAEIVENSIKEAQSITTENRKKVEQGNGYVKETAGKLKEIMNAAITVSEGAKQVLDASNDQSKGIQQINVAMNQVDKTTQENAATAEETASTSEELNSQVEVLNRVINELVLIVEGKVETSEFSNSGAPAEFKRPGAHHESTQAKVLPFKREKGKGANLPQKKRTEAISKMASGESLAHTNARGSSADSDEWEKL